MDEPTGAILGPNTSELEEFTEATSNALGTAYNVKAGGGILPTIIALIGPLLTQIIASVLNNCPKPPTPAKVTEAAKNPAVLHRMMLRWQVRKAKEEHPELEINTDIALSVLLEHGHTVTDDSSRKMLVVAKMLAALLLCVLFCGSVSAEEPPAAWSDEPPAARPEVIHRNGYAWKLNQAGDRWEPLPIPGYTWNYDQSRGQWAKTRCPCGPGCQCPPGQCPNCPERVRAFTPVQHMMLPPMMVQGGFGGGGRSGGC